MKINISEDMFAKTYLPFLFNYDTPVECYFGGAGSGKSFFITQKILCRVLSEKQKCLVCRKVANTLRDSVWQLFLDIISEWGLTSYVNVNKSNMTMTFFNGSMILFKGLDEQEKLKSISGINGVIWLEEASEFVPEDFDQLRLRLRGKIKTQPRQMYLSLNPINKNNWVYKRFFENGTPEDTFILKTTYKDNPFLPADYIKSLEDMINTNLVWHKIYALGEWCSLAQTVYTNWEIKDFDMNTIKGTHICGLDWGYSQDPSAFVSAICDEQNKTIYICEEFYQTGMCNPEIAKKIIDMGMSKSVIYADSAEPKSIEEVKRLGVYNIHACKKGPDSILFGIQRIQQYKIIVHPRCVNMINELENYVWKKDKKTNEYLNEPEDEYNHLCDALRYSMQCLPNTISMVSKKVLF